MRGTGSTHLGGFVLRTTLCFSWLVLGAILFPAVHAGSPAEPELTDVAGDAPPALDVLSAWWGTMDGGVTLTLQLSDILVGQPVADTNAVETRWYYNAKFTTSAYHSPITIRCVVGLVDSTPVHGQTITGDVGATIGTDCQSTRIPEDFNVMAYDIFTSADKVAGTLTLEISSNTPVVAAGPGVSFNGLTVWTGGGKATTVGIGHQDTLYDTTGIGAGWTA